MSVPANCLICSDQNFLKAICVAIFGPNKSIFVRTNQACVMAVGAEASRLKAFRISVVSCSGFDSVCTNPSTASVRSGDCRYSVNLAQDPYTRTRNYLNGSIQIDCQIILASDHPMRPSRHWDYPGDHNPQRESVSPDARAI